MTMTNTGLALFALFALAPLVARAQAEAGPPGPATSEPTTTPDSADAAAPSAETAPVTVAVRAPDAVDSDRLRSALEHDLGVQVEIVSPEADHDARIIVELTPEGLLRLRVRREGRPPLTRDVAPDDDRRRTTVTVSLLLSNLVRDESAELLALLRVPAPEPTLEPPTPPPVILAPAPDPVSPEPQPSEPQPPERETSEQPPEAETDAPLQSVPFAIDFAPTIGFSSAFMGTDRRAFSIGVIGGLEGALDGVSMSSVLDVSVHEVRGLQLAGVTAIAGGPLYGAQLSSMASVTGDRVQGAQLSAIASVAGGAVEGAQLSGVASIAGGAVEGAQLSGVLDVAPGRLDGVQLSGVAAIAGSVSGLQGAAGFALSAGPTNGAQLSTINVTAGPLSGAQLGVINVAGPTSGVQLGVVNFATDVDGAQLGVVNVAGRVRGLQLGVINVSERADAAIGLFSLHTRGRTHLRVGADSNGFLGASLVHGGGVTHSIVSAQVMPFLDRPTVALGLGFGARAQLADIVHLDVEGLAHAVLDERVGQLGPGLLTEARVLVGVRLLDCVALYAGLSYRVQIMRGDPVELGATLLEHGLGASVRGFPALLAGVELF